MKVYLATLGCKLNESELQDWSRRFAAEGHEIVLDPHEADLHVLNTCTVTHVASRKSRQLARQLARSNPQARLVLTGCYASMEPDQAQLLPNVALVIPNADKDRLVALSGALRQDTLYQTTETGCRLPEAVSGDMANGRLEQGDQGPLPWGNQPHGLSDGSARTRAFVKIMDGCNMSCTYCIIPLARGHEHSRPLREIVQEVQSLVTLGYQELVLTGVQVSVYEHNGDKIHGLRDLTRAILSETDVPRLRLTSIAPWDLDESLLELWQDRRLCRHIHLSLQSGSDTVLRRMRRAYTTAQFSSAAELARARISDLAITTDVIVGFPGESQTEFDQSREFVENMGFSRVHVFPYSMRTGTVAAVLPLQVSDRDKDVRVREMQAVADESAHAFADRMLGKTLDVLWESAAPATVAPTARGAIRQWSGYTDNYIRVVVASDLDLHNRILSCQLVGLQGDGASGKLVMSDEVSMV